MAIARVLCWTACRYREAISGAPRHHRRAACPCQLSDRAQCKKPQDLANPDMKSVEALQSNINFNLSVPLRWKNQCHQMSWSQEIDGDGRDD